MNILFEKWWKKNTKYFSIINRKEVWKKVGNKPRFCIHENGGRKRNGDKVFDLNIIIGYTIFNYTNWDLQR